MTKLNPFADETQSISIGGLTLENRLDRVSVYGMIDITKDKLGLNHARTLLVALEATVAALENTPNLPEELPQVDSVIVQRDPFA